MSQESHINATLGGMDYAERHAFFKGKNQDKFKERTFKERMNLAKEKMTEPSPYMINLAKSILKLHPDINIFSPNDEDEKKLAALCDPSGCDPAVIAIYCQDIENSIRKSS